MNAEEIRKWMRDMLVSDLDMFNSLKKKPEVIQKTDTVNDFIVRLDARIKLWEMALAHTDPKKWEKAEKSENVEVLT